ncbi:hypothetical protein DNU06_02190 [Putridiphycobacter roseus]|uniref:Uncharacterized protein n=1 Tax=Putridiphycobacter roseus TaxID=2219161 RepID=A0A2W1N689_9FLAO|nr:hypothetical protein [Putridiphycobacter roseus]PZE18661.1 hypothetical protein DNU06_02190 [Putridiphycobacter roseus]
MFGRFLKFIVLIGSLSLLIYGAVYVYQKQKFPINHGSFASENSRLVYVNDIEKLDKMEHGYALLQTYGVPVAATKIMEVIEAAKPVVTTAQIAFEFQKFNLSIAGLDLHDVPNYFPVSETVNGYVFQLMGNQILVEKHADYLVFSSYEKISLRNLPIFKTIKFKGNADFYYVGTDHVVESIKMSNEFKYSTFSDSLSIVKGKPVNPYPILTLCPTNAERILFYGSSRFLEDAHTLFSNIQNQHLSWVDNAIALVEKDSFSVIVAKENEFSNLKLMLMEETLKLAYDSLMPQSIYMSSIEIIPFKSSWNWQELVPDLKGDMKYFANYNGYVILTNKLGAMKWMIKNLQIGKTYEKKLVAEKVPTRLHQLLIQNDAGNSLAISFKTWIQPKLCFNALASTQDAVNLGNTIIHLEIPFYEEVKWLSSIRHENSIYTLVMTSEELFCFNEKGKQLWKNKVLFDPNMLPVVIDVDKDGTPEICFVAGKEFYLFTVAGKPMPGFPIKFTQNIHQFKIVAYPTGEPRILINVNEKVVNYAISGAQVNGWQFNQWIGDLNTRIFYQRFKALDCIYFTNQKDSLFVLNRKGEIRAKSTKGKVNFGEQFVLSSNTVNSQNFNLMYYQNKKLIKYYFESELSDTIPLKIDQDITQFHWLNFKDNKWLFLESFDKVSVYNYLGLLEFDMLKAEPNTYLLFHQVDLQDGFPFYNPEKNTVYLLDSYGNLMLKEPVDCEGVLSFRNSVLVTNAKNKIVIRDLNQ